jgi:hypothetical protein
MHTKAFYFLAVFVIVVAGAEDDEKSAEANNVLLEKSGTEIAGVLSHRSEHALLRHCGKMPLSVVIDVAAWDSDDEY